MRMMEERLAPSVKNGEEAKLCAEMLGIGGDRLQGLGGGVEQDIVDRSLVVIGDWRRSLAAQ